MFKKRLTILVDEMDKLIKTLGRVFYVVPASETGYGDFVQAHDPYIDGVAKVYTTVEAGYGAMVSGRNDILKISANAVHDLTGMLTVSKNRVHFESLDAGDKRMYGQATKIELPVLDVAADLGVIKNTGVRNSFKGIKFTSINTRAESLYTVIEAGEYALYENCEFYKETDLDETGAAELVLNGDSAQFKNCTFGSYANQLVGAIIRPCVLLTAGIGGAGKVCRDGLFENCRFWRNASHVNNRFVYGANATDVERMLEFKDCSWLKNPLSLAIPAQAIGFAASLTVGIVAVTGHRATNATKISTTTGVFIADPTTGILAQAS